MKDKSKPSQNRTAIPQAQRKRQAWVTQTGRAPSLLGMRRASQPHVNRRRLQRMGRGRRAPDF
jgi:hypothetical protein